MKRRICSVLFLLIFITTFLYSSEVISYFDCSYIWTLDSNITSQPLAQNVNSTWLEYRESNPYITKFSNGVSLTSSTYFNKNSRTGLSVSITWGRPYFSVSNKPVGDFESNWDYEKYDSLESQKDRFFFSIGPAFRAKISFFDFNLDLRVSVGTYTYFQEAIIMGIQASPSMSIFLNNNWYFKLGFLYDGHIIRLYLNNPVKIYDDYYMMNTLGGYVGIGYCFGGRDDK